MMGHQFALSKYNQEILATWIATKMLVAEFLTAEGIFTSAIERSLVMGRRLPPDITKIWLGHYLGSDATNMYFQHAAIAVNAPIGVIPIRPPDGAKRNIQSQTFIIGKLFVQTVTTIDRHLELNVPPEFSPVLCQIWPYRQEFTWPPSFGMSDGFARDITFGLESLNGRPLARGP
jgi:hypothetical protein